MRPEPKNPLPTPGATETLESCEPFLEQAHKASRVCIVLGSCGSAQLTVELTKTVLHFIDNSQANTTILCTEESVEPAAIGIDGVRVFRHTPQSETADCTPLAGRFTPQINAEFVKADLRVIIGELRPHRFLGFAGLCDLVFPGLSSEASMAAHYAERPASNPAELHRERIEIAASFENLFALGLGLDAELRASTLVFDVMGKSLGSLEPIINESCSKQITKRVDILVLSVGGAPFDSTLNRSVEVFPGGLDALKKEGTLIVAAECEQGHGGGRFYEWSSEHKEARYLESRLRHHFSYEGFKAAFLARTLQNHRVYLVSTIPDHYVESVFGMKPASTVNAALQSAQRTHGSESKMTVIPDASRVTPMLLEEAKP
ncbi:MAG TPA: lactate racemase domain-containing protein [Candidatus Acidoferrales bacterium]|nr:lactate racemase domain-containing protein [Candidatus Acidoferrales bacterium]